MNGIKSALDSSLFLILNDMSRLSRIQYPGAGYPVMNRGRSVIPQPFFSVGDVNNVKSLLKIINIIDIQKPCRQIFPEI